MQVMEGRGILRGDAASGCEKFVLAGERVAAPQGALALQPYILRALARMLGPIRVSRDVYRRLPIASIGQLTVP